MRFLLAGILAILPLTAQAESLVFMNAGESDSESVAPLSDTEQYCDSHSPEDEVAFCRNPYSPASPTNFEALIGPSIHVQGRRDVMLYDPRFPGMVGASEGGAGKLGFTNDRYDDDIGVSTARNVWRMPAAASGWPPYTYGNRN